MKLQRRFISTTEMLPDCIIERGEEKENIKLPP